MGFEREGCRHAEIATTTASARPEKVWIALGVAGQRFPIGRD